jgi:hypothetical protein
MNGIFHSLDTLSAITTLCLGAPLKQKMAVYEGLAKFDKPNFNSPKCCLLRLILLKFQDFFKKNFQFFLEFIVHLQ